MGPGFRNGGGNGIFHPESGRDNYQNGHGRNCGSGNTGRGVAHLFREVSQLMIGLISMNF